MPETPGTEPAETHGEAGKSAEHFGVTKTPAPDPAENTEEDQ
jgi:hypothetical protein